MADIHAFTSWLFAQGCPFVGLWGISMGAWFAGLAVCHDPRLGAAALLVPVPRLDRLIEEAKFCEPIRCTLRDERIDLRKLNLVSNVPVIDKKNILLIEAEHDLWVAKDDLEELWRAWDHPEIWRFRSGHISILRAPGLPNRVAQWLAARAQEPAAK
jgi:dienelactone hydrolase